MEYNYLVSIICPSFNHEKYIERSLQGFVIQKTSFLFEIIVHDDASNDNSASIIRTYESKYPKLFNAIFQSENKHNQGEHIWFDLMFPKVKGKYIALCEGDDYWTDPYKLQKQVDFLEANPDYGLVHTDCDFFYEGSNILVKDKDNSDGFYQPSGDILEYLLRQNCIKTLTVCFRKSLFDKIVDLNEHQQNNWLMGDYPMWLEFAFHSKIKYFPESTAVYRIRQNSASRSQDAGYNFKFLRSAYDIRIFMIKKFNLAPEILKEYTLRYADILFKYAHLLHEPALAREAKTMLISQAEKSTLRQKIYEYSSKSPILNSILSLFLNHAILRLKLLK